MSTLSWFDPIVETRNYLMAQAELANIPVSTTVPVTDEEGVEIAPVVLADNTLIRLIWTGQQRRTLVHRDTRVTVECWHTGGEKAAADLMEAVYQALDRWTYVPTFDGWAGGPYLQTDPTTGIARYVATVIVRHRTDS